MQANLNLLPDRDPLPPAALPRDEAGLVAWLRLTRSHRVGAQTFLRLMRAHGSAQAALDALPGVASTAGVRGYEAFPHQMAERELEVGRQNGARPVPLGSRDYPARLATIQDPPPLLWVKGHLAGPERACVALVGARNASALGMRMAAHLARDLGETGLLTVSGLARGIDTSVHRATTLTGTCAVLAGGLDKIYPAENADLAAEILEVGALVSEMPPGLQAQARHFPRRNRIIAGLTPGLVVIEGAAKSGSLITARAAADQGREVMAVPGHPFDARASGCNMLLRDGATLVRGADDIVAALSLPQGLERASPEVPQSSALTPAPQRSEPELGARVLGLLGPSPISEDALIRALCRPAAEVLAALARLDLEGRVHRHPGGMVSVAGH